MNKQQPLSAVAPVSRKAHKREQRQRYHAHFHPRARPRSKVPRPPRGDPSRVSS